MTISYPLTFPTIGINRSTFRFRPIIGESQSIYTGASQFYRHQGEWWEGEVTFRPMNHAHVGQVKAFLASLRGKYGTFLYGDPDYLVKGANGSLGGTPLIDGAQGAGLNSLNVKGFLPFTTPLMKGDYFQLGTGSSARLYMMSEDAVTDSLGETVLNFEPRTRVAVTDNQEVITSAPKCVMRLVDDPVEWAGGPSSIYEVSLAFRESLTI